MPTDPNRRFELLFRLYGPKKELFEMAWKLPDVQEVEYPVDRATAEHHASGRSAYRP